MTIYFAGYFFYSCFVLNYVKLKRI